MFFFGQKDSQAGSKHTSNVVNLSLPLHLQITLHRRSQIEALGIIMLKLQKKASQTTNIMNTVGRIKHVKQHTQCADTKFSTLEFDRTDADGKVSWLGELSIEMYTLLISLSQCWHWLDGDGDIIEVLVQMLCTLTHIFGENGLDQNM